MSQKLNVDLEKNPEVKDLAADLSIGDTVYLAARVATLDDKEMQIRIVTVSDTVAGLNDPEDEDEDEDEDTEDSEE